MHLRLPNAAAAAFAIFAVAACSDSPTEPTSKRPFQQPVTVTGTDPRFATRTEECPNRCMVIIDYSAVPITAGTPPLGRSSPGHAGWISALNENAVVVTEGGVVWSKTSSRTLSPLEGRTWVYASDINDYGQVAGASVDNVNIIWRATVWEPSGQALDVGTLGGESSRANAINDLPQVVGVAQRADNQEHAFIWTWNDGIRELTGMPAAATRSEARDINDQGQVVGFYWMNHKENAFVWSASTALRTLPVPMGTTNALAMSINEAGWIAGSIFTPSGRRAAMWKPTAGGYEFVDLGMLPNDARSLANAINHWGEVVGVSSMELSSPTRDLAFVYYAGNMVALSDETMVSSAQAINSWGDIAGRSNTDTGNRAVIWAWPENVGRYE